MPIERMAISFDPQLAEEVRRAAEAEAGGNVSAWLAGAAEARLRGLRLRALLARDEAKLGKVAQAELDAIEHEWPPG
jgi:hypothetical protein